MHVLTGDDWAFWEEQGYVIVHNGNYGLAFWHRPFLSGMRGD